MDNKPNRSIIPSQGGMLNDLTLRLKLIGRLMADSRVNLLAKLVPVASLAYLIWPIDAISIPIIGVLDDAAILWLASYLFMEMVPADVIKEHLKNLISNNEIIEEVARAEAAKEDDIIDGDVQEIK